MIMGMKKKKTAKSTLSTLKKVNVIERYYSKPVSKSTVVPNSISGVELLSHFTANIIKEKTVFTR